MSQSSPIVLVVAHGSRSKRWAVAVRDWFAGFRHHLGSERPAKLAFLEISEPLLGDVLREIAGSSEVIVFPFFLSRAGHVADDIPAAVSAVLDRETNWRMIPPVGWETQLGRNAAERLRRAGAVPGMPVVVSGYGSSGGDDEWLNLIAGIRLHAEEFSGAEWSWAPSGHFLADHGAPLRNCLQLAASAGQRSVAILPLYLSVSSYQEELIPSVSAEFPGLGIATGLDAILPDPAIEQWAARFVLESLDASSPHTSRVN